MKKVRSEIYGRSLWNRIVMIHDKVKAGDYPNCVQMAAEMEVSLRTVKRDVEYMMDSLRLPLEYDQRQHGFYYREPVDTLPSVAVTESEIFALMVAHKAVAQYQGTPFQRPLEMAFKKLSGQLDGKNRFTLDRLGEAMSFRPFAPDDTDLRLFQTVTRALQSRRELRFAYRNLGTRQAQWRTVRPYHLACIENHWYLFAFDLNRQAIRTFSLSRLSKPEMLAKTYTVPKDFKPGEYLKGSFNVFKGKDDFEVAIEFDAWATDLVRGRHWHASQEFTELPNGCSRMRMRLNSIEEIERWLLGWGLHATVIKPQALRERLGAVGAGLKDRYLESSAEEKAEMGPAGKDGTVVFAGFEEDGRHQGTAP